MMTDIVAPSEAKREQFEQEYAEQSPHDPIGFPNALLLGAPRKAIQPDDEPWTAMAFDGLPRIAPENLDWTDVIAREHFGVARCGVFRPQPSPGLIVVPRRSRREFTDAFVRKARPQAGARAWYTDAIVPGFELRVHPDGRRVFALAQTALRVRVHKHDERGFEECRSHAHVPNSGYASAHIHFA